MTKNNKKKTEKSQKNDRKMIELHNQPQGIYHIFSHGYHKITDKFTNTYTKVRPNQ